MLNTSGRHWGGNGLKDFNFALVKLRTFSTSQKFAEDKKSFQLSIYDILNGWKISHPLSSLEDRYTLSHAVRMGYDNSITSFS